VQDLCRLWGGPIISTSANRSGEPALRSEWAMRRNRLLTVDYVVPGQTQQRKKPSEIRDLQTGRIIRAG
jgi:L-threonylcarbamoyladenylate synthase